MSDEIHPAILSSCHLVILPSLYHIVNQTLANITTIPTARLKSKGRVTTPHDQSTPRPRDH